MLATYREEKVPRFFIPRHMAVIRYDKYYEKPVFKDYKCDTTETIGQMFSHDKAEWEFDKLCEKGEREKIGVESVLLQNYSTLLFLFRYLQGKSENYPKVTT